MFNWIKTQEDRRKLADYDQMDRARLDAQKRYHDLADRFADRTAELQAECEHSKALSADLERKSLECDHNADEWRHYMERAREAEAELASITNQRRTAAAKGRETQRAKREAAVNGSAAHG